MHVDESRYEAIAKLAYLLWESRGRPAGSAERDWLEAEATLDAGEALNAAAGVPTLDTPAKANLERRKSRANKSAASPKAQRANFP